MDAWKSTGKPPGHYAHVAQLSTLQYDDLCGQPGDALRICNIDGVVVSLGDFDNNEAASGQTDGTADREAWQNCFSPTIQLRSDNGVWPNPIGLKTPSTAAANGDANGTEDYWVDYEMYAGVMDPFSKGVLWRYGIMAWPGKGKVSLGGYPNWSNVRYPPYILFSPDQRCFRDILDNPIKSNGMLVFNPAASESPDWPDSVKIAIGNRQECYRFRRVDGLRVHRRQLLGQRQPRDRRRRSAADSGPVLGPVSGHVPGQRRSRSAGRRGCVRHDVGPHQERSQRRSEQPAALRRSRRLRGDHDERWRQHARRPGVPLFFRDRATTSRSVVPT